MLFYYLIYSLFNIILFVYISGPAVVRSREKVVPGQWMTILAERNQRDGSLSINNEQAEKGTPSHPPSHFDWTKCLSDVYFACKLWASFPWSFELASASLRILKDFLNSQCSVSYWSLLTLITVDAKCVFLTESQISNMI